MSHGSSVRRGTTKDSPVVAINIDSVPRSRSVDAAEDDEGGLTPDALAVWADACRGAGQPCANRCGLLPVCEALVSRAGGSKEDLSRAGAVLWDLAGSNEVTRYQYAVFLQYFGSIPRCLEKLRDVMTRNTPWFHGNRDREESEALLEQRRGEKTFLLRYSSNVGAFTVDYVKSGKICHFNNIRNDPDAGIEVTIGRPPGNQIFKYSSLSTFIIKNQHIFGEPCVNSDSDLHQLQQRLSSAEGFPSLAALLSQPPMGSSLVVPMLRGFDHSDSLTSPKGATPRDLMPGTPGRGRSHSDHERAQRLIEKTEKQAKKERKGSKKKKREKKQKEKSEAWTGDTTDVSLRIKQALDLAQKTSRPSLDLRSMRIGPDLPNAVCELRNLVSLDLAHNNLTELPDALGLLEKLETLDVTDNKLTSLNPNIFAANMRRLASLICADNLITSIPESLFEGFGRFSLSHVDLSCNQLMTIPKSISKLQYKLQFLDLSLNVIEKLPQAITKLTYLEEFYIKGNKLRLLPRRMSAMISLMVLDVADNQLHDIPDELFLLAKTMPGFVFIAHNNPMDSKAVEARMSMVQRTAPANHSVQDLFDVYNFGHKYDSVLVPPGAGSKVSLKPELVSPGRKETAVTRLSGSVQISYLPSLWKATEGYRLERAVDTDAVADEDHDPKLTLYEHNSLFDYRRFFYMRTVHTNIIGNEKRLGPVCVTIQKELKDMEPEDPHNEFHRKTPASYRVLIRTAQGDRVAEIPSGLVKLRKKERYARSNDLLQALKKHLDAHHKLSFSISHLYVLRDASSHEAFAELEDKLKVNSFKFGVLYAKEKQDEIAMYNNQDGSEGFEQFLSVLGDKIELEGWSKYSAGLDTTRAGHSVYTVFRGLEVMLHVSTYLPYRQRTDELGQQWDRKRHIGNDVVVIVYYEGTSPLDPAIFESQFNHVFVIVQPIPNSDPVSYRLHMAYKEGVSTLTDVRPPLPPRATFTHGPAFRDFLLTKLINAERCAMSAERFQKPTQRLRQILFSDLQDRFPKAAKSESQVHLFSLPRKKKARSPSPPESEYHTLTSPNRDEVGLGYFAAFPEAGPSEDTGVSSSGPSEYMTPELMSRVARELDKIDHHRP